MWQAVVASWLMVMSSGQLELNAPQNAVQPERSPPARNRPTSARSEAGRPRILPTGRHADKCSSARCRPSARLSTADEIIFRPRKTTRPTQAPPSPALPKPILTRQTYFSLPARAERARRRKQAARSSKCSCSSRTIAARNGTFTPA